MQLLNNSREKLQKLKKIDPPRTFVRLAIVIGSTLAYFVIFWLLVDQVGPIVSVFLSVPVIVAGFSFGPSAGLLASFIGIAINIYLQTALGGLTLSQVARAPCVYRHPARNPTASLKLRRLVRC